MRYNKDEQLENCNRTASTNATASINTGTGLTAWFCGMPYDGGEHRFFATSAALVPATYYFR